MPQEYLDDIYDSIWKVFPFISFDYKHKYDYYDDKLVASCSYRNRVYEKEILIDHIVVVSATPEMFTALSKHIVKEPLLYFSNVFMDGDLNYESKIL